MQISRKLKSNYQDQRDLLKSSCVEALGKQISKFVIFDKLVAWLDDIVDWRANMPMLSLSPKSAFWQLHLKDVQVVGPVHLSEEHYGVSMWTMMRMVMIEMRSDHLDAFP